MLSKKEKLLIKEYAKKLVGKRLNESSMTVDEFTREAKAEKNYNIYSVKKVSRGGDKGFKITYSKQSGANSQTNELEKTFWGLTLDEIAQQFLYN